MQMRLFAALVLGVGLVSAPYQAGAKTECNTTLTGTVNDSLTVLAGDICILALQN